MIGGAVNKCGENCITFLLTLISPCIPSDLCRGILFWFSITTWQEMQGRYCAITQLTSGLMLAMKTTRW